MHFEAYRINPIAPDGAISICMTTKSLPGDDPQSEPSTLTSISEDLWNCPLIADLLGHYLLQKSASELCTETRELDVYLYVLQQLID